MAAVARTVANLAAVIGTRTSHDALVAVSGLTAPPGLAAASATERAVVKAGDAVGDAALTGKVKTALIADPDLPAKLLAGRLAPFDGSVTRPDRSIAAASKASSTG